MMSQEIRLQGRSTSVRRQIISVDIPRSEIEADVDEVVIEIPMAFGRIKRITINADDLSRIREDDPFMK